MQHQRSFNQLPPLRHSLSNSSLLSSTNDNATTDTTTTTATTATAISTSSTSDKLPYTAEPQRQYQQEQHQYHRTIAPSLAHPRGESNHRSDIMYNPNYVSQYAAHSMQQPSYGALPQAQQGRMMPSAGPQSMLPPVYSQSAYGAPSLPGPMPYENLQQQSAAQHTLGSSLGDTAPFIGTRNNYKYELRVEQQPQRARMCGFGDKDRRPITPPPCVRLIVRRIDTDEEVDVDKIDGAFFVLQVDLWNDMATQEVNVIRASSNAPTQSISTAVPMSYPPPASSPYMDMGYGMGNSNGNFPMGPGYVYPNYVQPSNSHIMYTRNLIGSLTVNASLLKDLNGDTGYWFVLSDLSVRTEGWFRLRMTFIDVGMPSNNGESGLNRARCPILSTIFSDKFQVYSAKKFPGVIESTPLSKCFAQQGIKIPIRKDGKGDKNDDED